MWTLVRDEEKHAPLTSGMHVSTGHALTCKFRVQNRITCAYSEAYARVGTCDLSRY